MRAKQYTPEGGLGSIATEEFNIALDSMPLPVGDPGIRGGLWAASSEDGQGNRCSVVWDFTKYEYKPDTDPNAFNWDDMDIVTITLF